MLNTFIFGTLTSISIIDINMDLQLILWKYMDMDSISMSIVYSKLLRDGPYFGSDGINKQNKKHVYIPSM